MVNFAENYERLRDNLKDEKEASILVTKIRFFNFLDIFKW